MLQGALSTLRLARALPCAVSAIGSRGFASDALTELVRDFVNPETFVNHLRYMTKRAITLLTPIALRYVQLVLKLHMLSHTVTVTVILTFTEYRIRTTRSILILVRVHACISGTRA